MLQVPSPDKKRRRYKTPRQRSMLVVEEVGKYRWVKTLKKDEKNRNNKKKKQKSRPYEQINQACSSWRLIKQ